MATREWKVSRLRHRCRLSRIAGGILPWLGAKFTNDHVSLVQDGLLSCTMRELANMPDDNPKWILLDGDLDANWVESMNSVMDDSRLLTLPSNERIRLLPHMKMIFEIRDLKYATPVRGALTANLSMCKQDTIYAVGGGVLTSICWCPGAGTSGSTGATNGTERAHNHSIA
jgi:hypothetical protein